MRTCSRPTTARVAAITSSAGTEGVSEAPAPNPHSRTKGATLTSNAPPVSSVARTAWVMTLNVCSDNSMRTPTSAWLKRDTSRVRLVGRHRPVHRGQRPLHVSRNRDALALRKIVRHLDEVRGAHGLPFEPSGLGGQGRLASASGKRHHENEATHVHLMPLVDG